MADGACVGEFPHEIVGDQRLPVRVVRDKGVDMVVQEIGGDGHRSLLVDLWVAASSQVRSGRNVCPRPHAGSVKHTQYTPGLFETELRRSVPALTNRVPRISPRGDPWFSTAEISVGGLTNRVYP